MQRHVERGVWPVRLFVNHRQEAGTQKAEHKPAGLKATLPCHTRGLPHMAVHPQSLNPCAQRLHGIVQEAWPGLPSMEVQHLGFLKTRSLGTGELTQRVRAFLALAENLGSGPSTHGSRSEPSPDWHDPSLAVGFGSC